MSHLQPRPPRRATRLSAAALLAAAMLAAPACVSPPGGTAEDPAGIAPREAGWLRGDLHLHTAYSDGWDPLTTLIALGEFFTDPLFLAAHPEYRGSALDFLVITDHRTVAAGADPGFASDRLALVLGEEFGSPGHGNRIGITAHADHDPEGTGATRETYQAGVDAAHTEGGLFSANHPFEPGIPFPWDVRNIDAIEIWNSGWALVSAPMTEADLAEWETAHGPASPLYRRAVKEPTGGASMQALLWVEAHLARGLHVAVVGGSDRHTGFPPGFPTTWVRAETADAAGVVAGIRARHTFVSRTPASTQLLMTVGSAGQPYQQGDAVPVPAAGAEVTLALRVGRGEGGRLQLVCGGAVATDEALEDAPLGQVVFEEVVAGWEFEASVTRQVAPGDWCYPRVLDPLLSPGLSSEEAAKVRDVAAGAAATAGDSYAFLAELAADLVDPFDLIFDASLCDPASWRRELLQCLPPDADGMATFFVPDRYDRALNVITENGVPTDWSMGAVASAVRFVAD